MFLESAIIFLYLCILPVCEIFDGVWVGGGYNSAFIPPIMYIQADKNESRQVRSWPIGC